MSATQSIARFMSTPLEERLSRDHLLHARERLLDLFRRTVREVPAYREFLATQQFDPASVGALRGFRAAATAHQAKLHQCLSAACALQRRHGVGLRNDRDVLRLDR